MLIRRLITETAPYVFGAMCCMYWLNNVCVKTPYSDDYLLCVNLQQPNCFDGIANYSNIRERGARHPDIQSHR